MTAEEPAELERRIVAAVEEGEPVDLRAGRPGHGDPARDAARDVRALVLIELLTSVRTPETGRTRPVDIRGARVTGHLDLQFCTLNRPLLLRDCQFEQPITLSGAAAPVVRLTGCRLPGLVADQLQTIGDLDLDGVTCQGAITLVAVRIGGTLSLAGARLHNPGGRALSADRLTVGQDLLCGDGLSAEGEVSLTDAQIAGQFGLDGAHLINPRGRALSASALAVNRGMWCRDGFTADGEVFLPGARIQYFDLSGAVLSNPGGVALFADALTVERGMFLREGFTATGEVRLPRAHIGDRLSFAGATLINPAGSTLNLEAAQATTLLLLFQRPPDGAVTLTNAQVQVLHDEQETWPATMWLRGFTYQTLDNDRVNVRTRLRWLTRHPGGYVPQLYDQLAAAYQRDGHEGAARQVAIAKQWHRRSVLSPPGKLANWLLYLTVGYGYRTWVAAVWLGALLTLGTAAFSGAHPDNMTPANPSSPPFHAFAYTLDVLLPIVDFGQQKAWQPHGAALYLEWALITAGWILTTAVVAGLTATLKRD